MIEYNHHRNEEKDRATEQTFQKGKMDIGPTATLTVITLLSFQRCETQKKRVVAKQLQFSK